MLLTAPVRVGTLIHVHAVLLRVQVVSLVAFTSFRIIISESHSRETTALHVTGLNIVVAFVAATSVIVSTTIRQRLRQARAICRVFVMIWGTDAFVAAVRVQADTVSGLPTQRSIFLRLALVNIDTIVLVTVSQLQTTWTFTLVAPFRVMTGVRTAVRAHLAFVLVYAASMVLLHVSGRAVALEVVLAVQGHAQAGETG